MGNVQRLLKSCFDPSYRKEEKEMKYKKRDLEKLMSQFSFPDELKDRVRHEPYTWKRTKGLELDSFVQTLPKDIRRDIKRHIFRDLVLRVPMFYGMDEQLLGEICERLKPVLLKESCCIVREGDVVEEMHFVMSGRLESTTTYGGRNEFFNRQGLRDGDFCGEELLTWALNPSSSSDLPRSTRTVKSLTHVEAFALRADDLKFITSTFRQLHSELFMHTFRFYSVQWRTWAACYIQAAWWSHRRRKMLKLLREEEERLQQDPDALPEEKAAASTKLRATLYASLFVTNALHALRLDPSSSSKAGPPELQALPPPKPAEPDSSAEEYP